MAQPNRIKSSRKPKGIPTKKPNKSSQGESKKNIIISILVCTGVVLGGSLYYLNYEPNSIAENFYKDRKMMTSPQTYNDDTDSKTKATKSIFLQ